MSRKPSFSHELELFEQYNIIAGIDEAGLGPLAGPCTAAAVCFDLDNLPNINLQGLNDSKKLKPAQRERLFARIVSTASYIGIGVVSPEIIDRINVYWAGRAAMLMAIENLGAVPDFLLIDGNRPLDIPIQQQSVVKGDGKCITIAAASVVAKVVRDAIMREYHLKYPEFGFINHKGYLTSEHKQAIHNFGVTPIHRRSFKGVKEYVI